VEISRQNQMLKEERQVIEAEHSAVFAPAEFRHGIRTPGDWMHRQRSQTCWDDSPEVRDVIKSVQRQPQQDGLAQPLNSTVLCLLQENADSGTGADSKHPLKVNDGIRAVLATHEPLLRAPTPQQGTEVISVYQDADGNCQGNHLIGCRRTVELLLNLWIAIHLVTEMIQHIQKGWRVSGHSATSKDPPTLLRHGPPEASNFTRQGSRTQRLAPNPKEDQ